MTEVTKPFTRWEWFVYTPIALSFMAASAVLFAQGVIWLGTAHWYWIKLPDVGIHFTRQQLATGDATADKILMWLYDAPLGLWLGLIIPLTWRILTAITESVLPNR